VIESVRVLAKFNYDPFFFLETFLEDDVIAWRRIAV